MQLDFTDQTFKKEFIFQVKNNQRNEIVPVTINVHTYFVYRCNDYMTCELTRGAVHELVSC